jgi:hypothetical protein
MSESDVRPGVDESTFSHFRRIERPVFTTRRRFLRFSLSVVLKLRREAVGVTIRQRTQENYRLCGETHRAQSGKPRLRMDMQVTLELPDDVAASPAQDRPDVSRVLLERIATEGCRSAMKKTFYFESAGRLSSECYMGLRPTNEDENPTSLSS